jgi:class 3 adenylate cyclase
VDQREAWIAAVVAHGGTACSDFNKARVKEKLGRGTQALLQIVRQTNTAQADSAISGSWSYFNSTYSKYIPYTVRERFASSVAPLEEAEIEKINGVVAFVDISGFTKLSEKLAKMHGSNGAELLNRYISGYFQALIAMIVDYGGDIIKFAGDAMLVIWRNPRTSRIVDTRDAMTKNQRASTKSLQDMLGKGEETLQSLVLRAVACNLMLIKELNNFVPDGLEDTDICLTLHTGISCGRVSGIFVGGHQQAHEHTRTHTRTHTNIHKHIYIPFRSGSISSLASRSRRWRCAWTKPPRANS